MARVVIEHLGETALVRLDRPPVQAMDADFAGELESAFRQLERDDARAVVLTGAGRAFSAGLDLKAVPGYDAGQRAALVDALGALLIRVYGFPRPVIAALNGHALAGGLVLALTCDYRLAVDGADVRIGLTEARVGIPFPRVPHLVVTAELGADARFLMLTGRGLAPAEALRRGAVDELCPASSLMDRALDVAQELGAQPAAGYAAIKRRLRALTLERMRAARAGDRTLDALDADATRSAFDGIRRAGD